MDLADDVFDKQLQLEVVGFQRSGFINKVFQQLDFTGKELAGITGELLFPLTQVAFIAGFVF
ncbi:hypothetical protein D3C86_1812490 [compost metagenome]